MVKLRSFANILFRRGRGASSISEESTYRRLLDIALDEARIGLSEGGIPVGAALFDRHGALLGRGRNRRIQESDPSVHGETDAFRKAGRQRRYQDTIMVTTLAPCWYCSGLIIQFRIGTVVIGESRTFRGGMDWLKDRGVNVIDLASAECVQLLAALLPILINSGVALVRWARSITMRQLRKYPWRDDAAM